MKASILMKRRTGHYFDETEVAPAYMGAVEFTIPQSVTGDLK